MGSMEITNTDSGTMQSGSQNTSKEQIAQRYREACQKDSSIDHSEESTTKYYIISSAWMNNFLTYASCSDSTTPQQYDKNSKIGIITTTSADEKKSDSSYIDEGSSNHPGKIYNFPLIDSNSLQSRCSTLTNSANEVCDEANISHTNLKQGLSYGREYAIVGPSSWRVISECFGFDYVLARPIKILPDEKAAVEVYAKDVHVGTGMRLVILPLGGQWFIPNEIRQRDEVSDELPLLTNDLYPDNVSDEDVDESVLHNTTTSNVSSSQQLALVSLNSNYNDFQIDNPPARKKIRKMGRCGLSNLGNTCFMNSSLQCLSHTTPLRNYFLSDEFKEHLNRSNPLGTGGELAIEFAKLLHQMWRSGLNINTTYNRYYSDNSIVFSPSSFKATLGRNASQFIGYDQHDSQELATYLLDALHEDTNVVTNKPYVEKTEKKDDEDEHVAAARAWREYLRRDNSRIVESFMGQVKSRVQCPNENCLKVSTTFDPYMYLSVPIPGSQDRTITISFVPLDPSQNARKIKVTLLKSSTISTLKEKIGKVVGVAKENLVIGDVWKNEIYGFYKSSNEVSLLKDTDEVLAYQLEPARRNDEESNTDENLDDRGNDHFIIEINFRKDRIGYQFQSSHSTSENAFATPLIIRISSNLTVAGLRRLLSRRLKNFLNLNKYSDERKQALQKKAELEEEWPEKDSEFPPLPTTKYTHGKKGISNEAQKQTLDNSLDNSKKGMESDNISSTNDDAMSCESTLEDTQEIVPSRIESCFDEESNEAIFMRNLPLSYQRKSSHGSYSRPPPRLLGSLEKKDILEDATKLASPKDEREMETVAEIIGNNGRLNLYWSSQMVDYIDCEKWDKIEEIPINENANLDKKNNETMTLQKCIDNYCTKEQLEESDKWYCSNCKTHVRAWKQFHLYSTPPILIIQLKRFYFSSASHRRDKISTFIDFPLDGLDLRGTVMNWKDNEEPIYDCYAISNHYGGLGGGHYTAYAKNNGQWCYFDDSRVSEVSDEKEVVSEAAYVLYYHRRDLEDWDNIFPGSRGSSSPVLSTSSSSSSPPVSELSMMPRAVALPKSLQSTYPDNSETSDKEMESVISSSNATHASIESPMGSLVTDDLSDDAATEGNANSGSEMMN